MCVCVCVCVCACVRVSVCAHVRVRVREKRKEEYDELVHISKQVAVLRYTRYTHHHEVFTCNDRECVHMY